MPVGTPTARFPATRVRYGQHAGQWVHYDPPLVWSNQLHHLLDSGDEDFTERSANHVYLVRTGRQDGAHSSEGLPRGILRPQPDYLVPEELAFRQLNGVLLRNENVCPAELLARCPIVYSVESQEYV
jgi:hypothetical protein